MNNLVQILNEAESFVILHETEIKIASVAVLVSALPAYYSLKRGLCFIGDKFNGTATRREYDQLEQAQQGREDYQKGHNFRI